MRVNLFAYTELGSNYPGYISINRGEDGSVSVTVRAPPTFSQIPGYPPGCVTANCGDQVCLTLPADDPDAKRLVAALSVEAGNEVGRP